MNPDQRPYFQFSPEIRKTNRSIRIENFPSHWIEQDLFDFFHRFGAIENIQIVKKLSSNGVEFTRFGLVFFQSQESAEQAFLLTTGQTINGIPLKVEWTENIPTPSVLIPPSGPVRTIHPENYKAFPGSYNISVPATDSERHVFNFSSSNPVAGYGFGNRQFESTAPFPAHQRTQPVDLSLRSFHQSDSLYPTNIRERDLKNTFLYPPKQHFTPNPVLTNTNPLAFGKNVDNSRPNIDRTYFPSNISVSQLSNPDVPRVFSKFPDDVNSSSSPMIFPQNLNSTVRSYNPNNKSSDRKVTTAQIHFSYVSNRPAAVTLDELRNLFAHFGTILSVSLKKSQINKETNTQTGYGFVHYPLSPEGIHAAQEAVKQLEGMVFDSVKYACSFSHALQSMLDQQKKSQEFRVY